MIETLIVNASVYPVSSTRCFMLGEYKVSRCSRQCFVLERPLRDGEYYYSVVLEADEEFERRDISAEAWGDAPEGTIGVWKNRMPRAEERKMVLAPREVLIGLLRQMEEFPDKAKLRYLFALMLLRKKIVIAAATSETNPDALSVQIPSDGSVVEVATAEISRAESEVLLEQLNELLYCEASEIDEVPED